MVDLSRMLDDVYGGPGADEPGAPKPERDGPERDGPDWASEERLDEAFAGWHPGPADDAPAAERNLFGESHEDSAGDRGSTPLADDLAQALTQAVLSHEPAVETDEIHQPTPVPLAESAPVAVPEPSLPPVTESVPTVATFGILAAEPAPDTPVAEEPVPPVPTPGPDTPAPLMAAPWQRSDDDILPGGGRAGRSLKLTLRRK